MSCFTVEEFIRVIYHIILQPVFHFSRKVSNISITKNGLDHMDGLHKPHNNLKWLSKRFDSSRNQYCHVFRKCTSAP